MIEKEKRLVVELGEVDTTPEGIDWSWRGRSFGGLDCARPGQSWDLWDIAEPPLLLSARGAGIDNTPVALRWLRAMAPRLIIRFARELLASLLPSRFSSLEVERRDRGAELNTPTRTVSQPPFILLHYHTN